MANVPKPYPENPLSLWERVRVRVIFIHPMVPQAVWLSKEKRQSQGDCPPGPQGDSPPKAQRGLSPFYP
jgi:hypothetical protein